MGSMTIFYKYHTLFQWVITEGKYTTYTLPEFRRYNKADLGELVLLEILGKHQQGLVELFQLDIPCEVCKGLAKC